MRGKRAATAAHRGFRAVMHVTPATGDRREATLRGTKCQKNTTVKLFVMHFMIDLP